MGTSHSLSLVYVGKNSFLIPLGLNFGAFIFLYAEYRLLIVEQLFHAVMNDNGTISVMNLWSTTK